MKKRTASTRRAVARTAPRKGKGVTTRRTTAPRRSPASLVAPDAVFPTLRQHMLVDGFDIIIDLKRSRGSFIVDARTGKLYLDFFTFVASSPVGLNHPMMTSPDFQKKLAYVAVNKPSLSDIYTGEQADFLSTFSRVAIPEYLPHAFFIEGGALAVENALKAAFDWKIRKNFARGHREERGRQVIHFRGAFHGRSGYTLSLTNTDPVKTDLFPKFNWPRIPAPGMRFPMTPETTTQVAEEEARSIAAVKQAFHDNPDDVAAIIIEAIQGEGGDVQFRPEFFRALRQLADENEAMLIVDEVQTGVGMTGKMWAHQHYIEPDIISFGKKMQVCGILCSKRIEEVKENVFAVPSRINSTWGGNLVDMVRAQRYLEIIEKEKLVENARVTGAHLLKQLQGLAGEFPDVFSNPRGIGLFAAFDVVSPEKRTEIRNAAFDLGLIILPSGERSIRFRPPLNVTKEEIDLGIEIIRKSLTHE
jgi:L-lysine 6-transaminase